MNDRQQASQQRSQPPESTSSSKPSRKLLAPPTHRWFQAQVAKRLPPGVRADGFDPQRLRIALARASSRSAFDELLTQNQELLQSLSELRATQDELLQLNLEIEDTNRGVVALYAELDDRAEQLRDADGRKTRFLADMSHELRTPLNSIIGLAELLSDGPDPLTAEQRMQVEYIQKMATDQLRLVGELLDIAKIEAGRADVELGLISVQELFAVLRVQLRPLVAGSEVAMHFVCEPELPALVSDEQKLIQIMRNLVGNAVKYTREGEIIIAAANVDGSLELAVEDSGVGIPEDALERIFDEFVQVQGEHQRGVVGTGLGLPLTRKLTHLIGGSVAAESTLGHGSRFVVRLPWRPGADETAPGAAGEAAGYEPVGTENGEIRGTGVKKRLALVLVADDDPNVRQSVVRQLEPAAVEVAEVDGGEAALAFVVRRRPSVLVLDLTMPDMSGFEVLERLRATPGMEQLPVVIHTSRDLTPEEHARLHQRNSSFAGKDGLSSSALMTAVLAAGGSDESG